MTSVEQPCVRGREGLIPIALSSDFVVTSGVG